MSTAAITSYAAQQSVLGGEWDRFLPQLLVAVKRRMASADYRADPEPPRPPGPGGERPFSYAALTELDVAVNLGVFELTAVEADRQLEVLLNRYVGEDSSLLHSTAQDYGRVTDIVMRIR